MSHAQATVLRDGRRPSATRGRRAFGLGLGHEKRALGGRVCLRVLNVGLERVEDVIERVLGDAVLVHLVVQMRTG